MAANRLAARFRSPLVVFGIQLRRNVNDEAPHANQADGAEVSRALPPRHQPATVGEIYEEHCQEAGEHFNTYGDVCGTGTLKASGSS